MNLRGSFTFQCTDFLRHRGEDNIKNYPGEITWENVYHTVSGILTHCCESGNEPSIYIKCQKFLSSLANRSSRCMELRFINENSEIK
jgi:hypothetical protein